jgi:hypothetical protein
MAYDREGQGVPLVFLRRVATDRRLWHHPRRIFYRRYRFISADMVGCPGRPRDVVSSVQPPACTLPWSG